VSAAEPKTLPEWKAYVGKLDGEELRREALAANSTEFVRTLQEEGYAAGDIHEILIAYAKRLAAVGQRLPSDGYLDFTRLA
jgi:hypothetical protein